VLIFGSFNIQIFNNPALLLAFRRIDVVATKLIKKNQFSFFLGYIADRAVVQPFANFFYE